MVQILIETGENLDLNITASDGSTACHMAARKGYAELLRYLIEQNANYVLRDTLYPFFSNVCIFTFCNSDNASSERRPLDVAANMDVRLLLEKYYPPAKSYKYKISDNQIQIWEDQFLGKGRYGMYSRCGILHRLLP